MPNEPFLRKLDSTTIAAGGTGSVTIPIPGMLWSGQKWGIKKIEITSKGTNVTVTDIKIDGNSIGETDTIDLETLFGSLIIAKKEVAVDGSNAGAGSENLEVTIFGAPLLE